MTVVLVLLATTVAAWAYWSEPGTGAAAAISASLDPSANSVSGSGINFVTVTWTQQASLLPSSSNNSAITYTVERQLGGGAWTAAVSGGCSGAKPYGTTSCVDSPPAAGSYTYRVVAHYHSWTATSAGFGPSTVVLDSIAPTVQSINRLDPSPTNASSVRWSVTFSEAVTGVDAGDFTVAGSGTISSVTGSGTTYTVSAATGVSDATFGLDVTDNDTITDAGANKLGGTGAGNGNLTGQTYIVDKTAPVVSSIAPAAANPTNASSVTWTVTFSESVSGVGTADFALAGTGTSGASISSVTGSAGSYTVTAATGANGTLGLNLVDDDSITDGVTNRLGGTGTGNGNFTGQTYTVDRTAPTVSSIALATSSPSNASSVSWTVTFSESVTGVGTADFALAGTATSGASITGVSGSASSYTVTVATSGDGTLGLNLVDDDSIADAATNKLGGTGTGNGNLAGQTYTIDRTAPTVSSIVLASASPTNATSVSWTVTFSESVTGVGAADFALAGTAASGASITAVSGSAGSYTVTVSTNGNGTLGVNLVDDDSIADGAGNSLGGTGTSGAGNGSFTGQTYTIDKTVPTVSSIALTGSTLTNAASVSWTITFSESVTGVGTADFALAGTATTGATITGVSGSAGSYTVTASTGGGDGTLGLNLVDDDSIADAATNKLGGTGTSGAGNGSFTGSTYTMDKTAPGLPTSVLVTSGVVWSPASCGITAGTHYINATATSASASTVAVSATVVPEAGETITFVATSGATSVTTSFAATSASVAQTLNLSSLAEGAVTLTARTQDAAGNASATVTSATLVIKDTVAAALSGLSYNDVVSALGARDQILGTSECGATIVAVQTVGGSTTYTSSPVGAGGTFTLNVTAQLLSSYSYNVTATDRAGNASAVSVVSGNSVL
jgi:hypothetical protein